MCLVFNYDLKGQIMIYIVGHKGRLGSQLIQMGCRPLHINITDQNIKINLSEERDIIINCASKTDVDRCEHDQIYYWDAVEVNGYGIRNLAENNTPKTRWKGKILHISTDYVFAGKRGPYSEDYFKEDDVPTRKMSYAVTKFMGELYAKEYENIHIIRTTGLYGGVSLRNNFLNMILDNYNNGVDNIYVTNELHGNQTYIPHFAEALIACTRIENLPKILHIASKDVISRYEFAFMIAEVYGLDGSKIIPVKNDQVPGWIAKRPVKGGLKVKAAEKLGLPLYSISQGLEASKNEYLRQHNHSVLQ